MKYIFCDTETTGTDPRKHTMWELSYVILSETSLKAYNENSFDRIQTLYIEPGKLWEPVAEKMYNEVAPYIPSTVLTTQQAYNEFLSSLDLSVSKYERTDKLTFVGYNSKFDWDFIYTWMKEIHGNEYTGSYFFFPPIDVAQECSMALGEERKKLKNFKLGTVANHFGIEVKEENLHQAFYDVHLTILLFKEALERRKENNVADHLEEIENMVKETKTN